MDCEHNWTIKFNGINDDEPFEVRPVQMNLKMSRTEYDFCRAKLPWEVGEEMKPHTRFANGQLYGNTPVDVCYNGKPIQRLLFRPDWVNYGNNYTHLKLKDLHKALSSGSIDERRQNVTLEKIYTDVINSTRNRIIDEVEFTYPDTQVRTLYGSKLNDPDSPEFTQREQLEAQREADKNQTERVVESDFAVDFDGISPERAIQRLNKKFRLQSWVNREGELIVGLPEANGIRHIAAPNDERVWRYKDPSISHGREPIKSVLVWGAWEDEPGFGFDPEHWFSDESDVRAVGVAKRTDIDYGTSFTVSSSNAKKGALPEIAKLALENRMKQQNAGTVEIDPELSGTGVSDTIDYSPGDILQLVPDDSYFDNPGANSGVIGDEPEPEEMNCTGFVNNEAYVTSEVEHNVTEDGDWQIHADLSMHPDVPIKSYMTYFDPSAEEWLPDEELGSEGDILSDDDELSFDLFERFD